MLTARAYSQTKFPKPVFACVVPCPPHSGAAAVEMIMGALGFTCFQFRK